MITNPVFPMLTGPRFLACYIIFSVLLTIAVIMLSRRYRILPHRGTRTAGDLTALEIAVLSGAASKNLSEKHTLAKRAVSTALFSLYRKGFIILSNGAVRQNPDAGTKLNGNGDLDQLETLLYGSLPDKPITMATFFPLVRKKVENFLVPVLDKLEQEGILLPRSRASRVNLMFTIGAFLIFLPGCARFTAALFTQRPFGFLLAFLITWGIIYYPAYLLSYPGDVSAYGTKLFQELKKREEETAHRLYEAKLPLETTVLLVALFGHSTLSGSGFHAFADFIQPGIGSATGYTPEYDYDCEDNTLYYPNRSGDSSNNNSCAGCGG